MPPYNLAQQASLEQDPTVHELHLTDTSSWNMPMAKDPPVKSQKDCIYTLKEFELLNNWLKTNELVIEEIWIKPFQTQAEGKAHPSSTNTDS